MPTMKNNSPSHPSPYPPTTVAVFDCKTQYPPAPLREIFEESIIQEITEARELAMSKHCAELAQRMGWTRCQHVIDPGLDARVYGIPRGSTDEQPQVFPPSNGDLLWLQQELSRFHGLHLAIEWDGVCWWAMVYGDDSSDYIVGKDCASPYELMEIAVFAAVVAIRKR